MQGKLCPQGHGPIKREPSYADLIKETASAFDADLVDAQGRGHTIKPLAPSEVARAEEFRATAQM